ncbi:MAG: acetylxylan esterase [Candidatus Omnitrophota bacterium]
MKEEEKRGRLYRLLGDLPDRRRPVSSRLITKEEQKNFVLERLSLNLNGLEEVPACFVYPKKAKGRVPGILFNHSHGGRYNAGKDELLESAPYMFPVSYAEALTKEGYAALAIDAWNFGERAGRTESELFKEMLWKGQVLWGMMVYDSLRAIDYLVSRTEVNKDRLGTMGMSMGSTMAWWVAALDIRIKVCVDICCLTDFHSLINRRGLDGHGIYYYVPGLLKEFDTAGINSLIAPRAHLALAGNFDLLTPPEGLDKIDAALKKVYQSRGRIHPTRGLDKSSPYNAWRMVRYNVGHRETAEMRKEVLAFFRKKL